MPDTEKERLAVLETKVKALEKNIDILFQRFNRVLLAMLTLAWSVLLGLLTWSIKSLAQ